MHERVLLFSLTDMWCPDASWIVDAHRFGLRCHICKQTAVQPESFGPRTTPYEHTSEACRGQLFALCSLMCNEMCRVQSCTAPAAVLTQGATTALGATGALGTAQLWMETQAAATPRTASQPRPPGAALHQLAATHTHPARHSMSAAGGVLPTRWALPGPSQNAPHCNLGDRRTSSQHVTPAPHHVDPGTNPSPLRYVEVHQRVLLCEVSQEFLLDHSILSCLKPREDLATNASPIGLCGGTSDVLLCEVSHNLLLDHSIKF